MTYDKSSTAKVRYCAIYTRKSSEEGLEQDFNSLHAQREACEAFIKSQKHEGWQVIKTQYDDGGFSGGNIQRPALKQLLSDIAAGKVHIVIVYKVDRLTRSLSDFAKIIEQFDSQGVSFVSVTQQFNTTSSMGRLTLNVLLSFAQFEREVTGERIRDKIAASKQKGMWMGGCVPIGYDVKDRKLLINDAESKTVQYIYSRYLEFGCIRLLKEDLDKQGIVSKIHEKSLRPGGASFSLGALCNILSNRIYIGQVRHKKICYPGQHSAIITQTLWDQVQQQLKKNAPAIKLQSRKTEPSLLTGKMFDVSGDRLTPSHAVKKGRRYRYYISRSLVVGTAKNNQHGWRLPAQEIEQAVAYGAVQIMSDQMALTNALQESGVAAHRIPEILTAANRIQPDTNANTKNTIDIINIIDTFVTRVELYPEGLSITVSLAPLIESGIKKTSNTNISTSTSIPTIMQNIPMRMKRCGMEMRLIIDSSGKNNGPSRPDPTLIRTIIRAHKWFNALASGRSDSVAAIAKQEGIDKSYVNRVIHLAFLAPDITESILAGKQPADLNVEKLTKRIDLPMDWQEQHRTLGFA